MISPDRIMGFVEGEACFGVSVQRETDNRPRKTERINKLTKPSLGYRVKPSFRIFLAAKDRKILDEICATLETGYVYVNGNPGNRSDTVQYAVQETNSLLKLIEFFDEQTFYTTKGESYQKWREIVQMVSRKEHLSKEGFLKICYLREQMNLIFNKEKHIQSGQFLESQVSSVDRI